MFKTSKLPERHQKCQKTLSKNNKNKVKNLEGNLNITKKRITIPPEFISLDVGSGIRNKSSGRPTINSSRNTFSKTANKINNTGRKVFTTQNRQNSLFREINERYAKTIARRNLASRTTKTKNHVLDRTTVANENFCVNLSNQVKAKFKRNCLKDCASKIFHEIQEVNDIICGKLKITEPMTTSNEIIGTSTVEDTQLFPRCDWVFETPPKQKIAPAKLVDHTFKPALLHTTTKCSTLYEIHCSNILFDSRYCNSERNNIQFMFDVNPVDPNGETPSSEQVEENSCYQPLIDLPHKSVKSKKIHTDNLSNTINCFFSESPMEINPVRLETKKDISSNLIRWETPSEEKSLTNLLSRRSVKRNISFDNDETEFFGFNDKKNNCFEKKNKLFDFSKLKK